MAKEFRVKDRGLEWEVDGESFRAEPGELLPPNFPAADIPEHLESGLIEETARKKKGAKGE